MEGVLLASVKYLHFSGPALLPAFSVFFFFFLPGVQCDARWEQRKVLRDPLLVPFTVEPISRVPGGHCDQCLQGLLGPLRAQLTTVEQ